MFMVFVIPQAVARNFATLIVCRFIAGCCGGVLQAAMDGIIADIWLEAPERSLPVTLYVFSLLTGVTFGPVLGGAVIRSLHWPWYELSSPWKEVQLTSLGCFTYNSPSTGPPHHSFS